MEIKKAFPMLALKDWAECLLRHKPEILLAGHALTDASKYEPIFESFWECYQLLDRDHPFYNHFPPDQWGKCTPFAVHGDEGRGKARSPVLITSYQVLIPEKGLDFTNMTGSSYTTRFLSSIMPSNLMTLDDHTLDDMQHFMVDDLVQCFYEGIEARSDGSFCVFCFCRLSVRVS